MLYEYLLRIYFCLVTRRVLALQEQFWNILEPRTRKNWPIENPHYHFLSVQLARVSSPCESITGCRVSQLEDENVWLLLHGNAITVHMCLAYKFTAVIIESWQGKEQNWAFLTALGNQLAGLPHNRKLRQESGELYSLYNSNPAKLAAVWCLELCADTLFAEVWCCSEHYIWLFDGGVLLEA